MGLSSMFAAQADPVVTLNRTAIGNANLIRMRNLCTCGIASLREYEPIVKHVQAEIFAHTQLRQQQGKSSAFFSMTSTPVSRFLFEQLETLACLPFLVGELAGRGIKKMMVVGRSLRLLVQRIVGCRPEEIRGLVFRKVF
jgi:hypothetical protein